jgi:hypothetical protein
MEEEIKSTCENCTNLERLNICPSYRIREHEIELFPEYYQTELFVGNHKYKSTHTANSKRIKNC